MVINKMKKSITIAGLQESLFVFFEKWNMLRRDGSLKNITNIMTALERLGSSIKGLEIFPNLIEQAKSKLIESYYEEVLPALKGLLIRYDNLVSELIEIKENVELIRSKLDVKDDDYYIHILDKIDDILEMYESDYFVKHQIAGLVIEDAQERDISMDLLNIFLLVWNLEPYIDGKQINDSINLFEDCYFELEEIYAGKSKNK